MNVVKAVLSIHSLDIPVIVGLPKGWRKTIYGRACYDTSEKTIYVDDKLSPTQQLYHVMHEVVEAVLHEQIDSAIEQAIAAYQEE